MKVLMLGGAGHVGSFITPYLQQRHELRVLDLRPPRHAGVEYIEGSVSDPDALRTALTGVDAFIWVVMRKPQGGTIRDQDIPTIIENYEINTKALHLTLFIAQELGVTRGIYTSSMSVHYRMRDYFGQEEATPYDTPTVYGLSKGFGEQICQYFARWWDMNLIALRITGPRTREQFLDERRNRRVPEVGSHCLSPTRRIWRRRTSRRWRRSRPGTAASTPSSSLATRREQEHNLSKAKRVLGWEPRSQRLLEG